MTKNFNRDLDQADDEQRRKAAHAEGRNQKKAPDANPEVARERTGEGFKGPADEYSEAGSGGAGYRQREAEQPKKSDK